MKKIGSLIAALCLLGLIYLIYPMNKTKEEERPESLKLSELDTSSTSEDTSSHSMATLFNSNPEYRSDGFDFPVGKPDGIGYYNAQKFQVNYHLGDDWNGRGGGDTDLGDTIYSIGNGYVSYAYDAGSGWGNVIRIIHQLKTGEYVESLYAHCDEILIHKKQWIKKGGPIGTIGTADGIYLAHLHFEIRNDTSLSLGPGYSSDTIGYLDPTAFIKNHR